MYWNFYDIYMSHGANEVYTYSRADWDKCPENHDIAYNAADCSRQVTARLAQVRLVGPRVER